VAVGGEPAVKHRAAAQQLAAVDIVKVLWVKQIAAMLRRDLMVQCCYRLFRLFCVFVLFCCFVVLWI
jgi:hypothetical protein